MLSIKIDFNSQKMNTLNSILSHSLLKDRIMALKDGR